MASLFKVEVIPGFPNRAGFTDRGCSVNFRMDGISVLKSHVKKPQFQESFKSGNLNPHSLKHALAHT